VNQEIGRKKNICATQQIVWLSVKDFLSYQIEHQQNKPKSATQTKM
jgi:hypothetical protein